MANVTSPVAPVKYTAGVQLKGEDVQSKDILFLMFH